MDTEELKPVENCKSGETRAHNAFEAPETIKPAEFKNCLITEAGFKAVISSCSIVSLEVE